MLYFRQPVVSGVFFVVGEVILGLRKWAFLCAVAVGAAIVGCGGNKGGVGTSSSSGSSTSGTGGFRANAATVSIPNKSAGLVYTGFLTGAARTIGDLYLNIENENISDSFLGRSVSRTQTAPVRLHLGNYTFQYATIDVNMTGLNSELFDHIDVVPYSFGVEEANGSVALNPGDVGYFATDSTDSQITAPIRLRVFPGRDSSIPVLFDNTMFAIDADNSAVGMDTNLFQTVNMPQNTFDSTTSGKIAGFISDMVQFDLTHIPAANIPQLAVSKAKATHFYLSGDNYAMSDDAPGSQTGNFEELTTDADNPMDGTMGQPNSIQSQSFQFGNLPGTYDLLQANPVLFAPNPTITSLFGRWRKATDLINMTSTTFDIIVFPNSNESYTQNSQADAIAIAHTGSTITNFYIGSAYFTASSGAPTAKFVPLPSFITGSTAGEVDYTLSGFLNSGGASTTNEPSIRYGSFTKTGNAALPAGFASSGTFVVFR